MLKLVSEIARDVGFFGCRWCERPRGMDDLVRVNVGGNENIQKTAALGGQLSVHSLCPSSQGVNSIDDALPVTDCIVGLGGGGSVVPYPGFRCSWFTLPLQEHCSRCFIFLIRRVISHTATFEIAGF